MDIYLVGGAVRDQLLGLPVKDRDFLVVGATAEQLLAQGFQQVGADFPVFYTLKPKKNMPLLAKNARTAMVTTALFAISPQTSRLSKI